MSVNVAIVGATGAVGQEFLAVLAERKFPIRNIKFLARARSAVEVVTSNEGHAIRSCPSGSEREDIDSTHVRQEH